MNTNDWLIKLCAKQPTKEAQFEQQVKSLPREDIDHILEEPKTESLDGFQSQVHEAEEMGRQMAHQQGPGAYQQAEAEVEKIASALDNLSEDELVAAASMLENGELTKEAFLSAVSKGVGSLLRSGGARKAVGAAGRFAKKNPNAALAVGGAAAGGLANKASGGSFTRGALTGGAVGYGAGRLGKVQGKTLSGALGKGYGKALRSTAPFMKSAAPGGPVFRALKRVKPPPVPGKGKPFLPGVHSEKMRPAAGMRGGLRKTAEEIAVPGFLKAAYHRDDWGWLEQFEGTPLLQKAVELEKQLLEAEAEDIQRRIEERSKQPSNEELWNIRDELGMKKKHLELELIAHRNGLDAGEGSAEGEEPEEMPQEEGMTPQEGEMPPEAAEGQESVEAIKEAVVRGAVKNIGSKAGNMAKRYGELMAGGSKKGWEKIPKEFRGGKKLPRPGNINPKHTRDPVMRGLFPELVREGAKSWGARGGTGAAVLGAGALAAKKKKKDKEKTSHPL